MLLRQDLSKFGEPMGCGAAAPPGLSIPSARESFAMAELSDGAVLVNDEASIARKIGENESRFRDANERIETAALRFEADVMTLPFICECGRMECLQTIRLTIAEYELARAEGTYFVCIPGHEITANGIGRVVNA